MQPASQADTKSKMSFVTTQTRLSEAQMMLPERESSSLQLHETCDSEGELRDHVWLEQQWTEIESINTRKRYSQKYQHQTTRKRHSVERDS